MYDETKAQTLAKYCTLETLQELLEGWETCGADTVETNTLRRAIYLNGGAA